MPAAAPRPCTYPGCSVLVFDGTGRCPKHPDQRWQNKRTDVKRKLTGRALQRARALLFQTQPFCAGPDSECERAGRSRPWQEMDHKMPLSQGGSDDPSNWQGLCRECHDAKTRAEAVDAADERRERVGRF